MADNQNPKRYKTLHSWFKNGTPSSVNDILTPPPSIPQPRDQHEGIAIQEDGDHQENEDEHEEVQAHDILTPPPSIPQPRDQHEGIVIQEDGDHQENEDEHEEVQAHDITSLERDPGKRRPIGTYPLNEQDSVRRAYVLYGPCQPFLDDYPSTWDGAQGRKFCHRWYKEWPWLEYSLETNKAYCFPCFLFDSYPSRHPSFTDIGFNGWKHAMSKQGGIVLHVGGVMSVHNASMYKWQNLRNPSRHIERVMNKLSSQELAKNRLRLVTSIEAVRLLARQGCAFRGHDESVDSLNGGNFDAVLDTFKRMNDEVNKVVNSAPQNAKYTSPPIQKQIANLLGNKVRAMIRNEIGDSKFTILVDEALDVANKEQMAIILRFVDREGFLRERFFKVISVDDTCSQTLKDKICQVFTQYDLKVENIRGQGYDGASNMRGQFKGLQALFLRDCPYAYYVHCFAHRLQLSLNAAAKGVHDLWQFFSTLTMIVNFVYSSAKRHSMLKTFREAEISDLVAASTFPKGPGNGKGKNQACTLQRAGATRWGSHFRSISSLIKLFGATRATIDDLYMTGLDKVQGEAKAVGKALKKFDFVFCLHMMHDIMRTTDFLCQVLQKKDLDILNALHFLSITKDKLRDMRENGWDDLIMKVTSFACDHGISVPDMSAPYKKGLRGCEQGITFEEYYRAIIFYGVIDFQLSELKSRFTDSSLEILVFSASFDPRNNFRAFKHEDVCKLALKYYPADFSSHDRHALDLECEFFVADVKKDSRFANTTSTSDLCRRMVEFGKTSIYPMIYKLICLILTLPVSTATTERAFSSMNIIKSKLRNKMNDEFLDDLMVLYIERTYADKITNDEVIKDFELSRSRRSKFS